MNTEIRRHIGSTDFMTGSKIVWVVTKQGAQQGASRFAGGSLSSAEIQNSLVVPIYTPGWREARSIKQLGSAGLTFKSVWNNEKITTELRTTAHQSHAIFAGSSAVSLFPNRKAGSPPAKHACGACEKRKRPSAFQTMNSFWPGLRKMSLRCKKIPSQLHPWYFGCLIFAGN